MHYKTIDIQTDDLGIGFYNDPNKNYNRFLKFIPALCFNTCSVLQGHVWVRYSEEYKAHLPRCMRLRFFVMIAAIGENNTYIENKIRFELYDRFIKNCFCRECLVGPVCTNGCEQMHSEVNCLESLYIQYYTKEERNHNIKWYGTTHAK